MLARFSLLTASWANFSRRAAFCRAFCSFFFATWGAPASILERQVGHILARFSLLAAFFDTAQELLQKNPAGVPFLFFVSTMQRGGTCAAHGILTCGTLKKQPSKRILTRTKRRSCAFHSCVRSVRSFSFSFFWRGFRVWSFAFRFLRCGFGRFSARFVRRVCGGGLYLR